MASRPAAQSDQPIGVDPELIGVATDPADRLAQIFKRAGPAWLTGPGQQVVGHEHHMAALRQPGDLRAILGSGPARPASPVNGQHSRVSRAIARLAGLGSR